MTHNIDLLIFDCDGVLIDSEYLFSQIAADLITQAGYPIDHESLSREYSGLVPLEILKKIESKSSIPFSYQLVSQMEKTFIDRMQTDLHPIKGIHEALEKLTIPYCICSNASLKNLEDVLKLVGLFDFFKDKIFSAPDMGTKKSKPAPDIFLFAAQKFDVLPQNCVVLEDSVYGIEAARKAGMRAVGFIGGKHSYRGHAEKLSDQGAETVINQHKDLIPVLKALSQFNLSIPF